jgi:type I restriction enzyme S subunit
MTPLRYLSNVVTLRLDETKCTGCGMCETVCPHAVFRIDEHRARIADRDACMECGACARNGALDVIDYVEISEVMGGEIGTISRYVRGEEPSRARRQLTHGDTVLSTVRADRRAYFLALHPTDSLIASTGFAVLTPSDGSWAFLHAATTVPEFGQELGRLADGGAYPAIRPEVVGARQIVLPNHSRLIAAFDNSTQPLFLRADSNRSESRTLAALRDTLLPKLLSGEIRVAEAEKIVEDVA